MTRLRFSRARLWPNSIAVLMIAGAMLLAVHAHAAPVFKASLYK